MIRCHNGKCWDTAPNVFDKIGEQYDKENLVELIELDLIQDQL